MAYMRNVPNMVVSAPMNEQELRNLMYTSQLEDMGPFSIRYPRGQGVMPEWKTPLEKIEVGKGRKLHDGEGIAVLSIGHIGNYAVKAIKELNDEGIKPAHYDMRFVKPLDEEILHEVFSKFKRVITIEDGCLQGGFGSAIIEFMADHNYSSQIKRLGIPDKYIQHGSQDTLYNECGYGINGIKETVLSFIDVEAV